MLAGQAITKKTKQKGARQTKLTSMMTSQKASTLPSVYGEVIQPIVPEFHEKAVKKPRAVKSELITGCTYMCYFKTTYQTSAVYVMWVLKLKPLILIFSAYIKLAKCLGCLVKQVYCSLSKNQKLFNNVTTKSHGYKDS